MLRQDIALAVQEAVQQSLTEGTWRAYEGPFTEQLVRLLGQMFSRPHVLLTSSGTSALEIVLRAAGIGAGDEVLLSAYDYPGNFWAIERVGARPVLVDVQKDSWSIDVSSLMVAYGPQCKAVIASHLHGELQVLERFSRWCKEHRLLLIEDACQAVDASAESIQSGRSGDAVILSFGGGKQVSCGRGGALLIDDELLAQRARIAAGAGSGPYSLSEVQAAIVTAQLPWLKQLNEVSFKFFGSLQSDLAGVAEIVCVPVERRSSAYYQMGFQLHEAEEEDVQKLIALLRGPNSMLDGRAQRTLPFGGGFPGFHRRSARRCRLPVALDNAALAACRTITLHHSVAMEEALDPSELAGLIQRCVEQVR